MGYNEPIDFSKFKISYGSPGAMTFRHIVEAEVYVFYKDISHELFSEYLHYKLLTKWKKKGILGL